MRNIYFILLCMSLLAAGCKDPYLPELQPGQTNVLVVEGFISPGDSATRIRLSRTVAINDTARIRAERGAQVAVEGEDNTRYPLVELAGGEYVAPVLNLDRSRKYRISIRTSNGSSYVSEFVVLKQTPAVNLNWSRGPAGVQISFSSQDPQGNTRYYRWNFEETWELRSRYAAQYKLVNDKMEPRQSNEQELMRICWARTRPASIRLVSTVQLAQDVINQEPVVFIPNRNEKLDVRYSILVRLQALDQPGYAFFQQLRRNTESLGTLFDPQPSEVRGNVRSVTNSREQVIGYIAGSIAAERRIFINSSDVSGWGFNPSCYQQEVPNHPDSIKIFTGDGMVAWGEDDPVNPTKYYGVENKCADCRDRGNNERPRFW